MNILLYFPFITKEAGGVFQYTTALLNILKEDKKNTYWIVSESEEIDTIISTSKNFKKVKYDIRKLLKSGPLFYRILKKIKQRYPKVSLNLNSYIDNIVRKYNIDIIHCPYQGYVETRRTSFITTMHDVQELHFPEFFTSEQRANRAINYKQAIEKSTKVIVSYKHVKDDLLRFFDVKAENIDVILLDMQNLWFERFSKDDISEQYSESLPQSFLLLPAATWKHKNHMFLIKAIKELKDEGININLICTGHQTEYYSVLREYIKQHSLDEQIYFKGIVTDIELYSLYNKCTAVVIPTLYEAGSFPLYESILLNIPVICSDTTSLPETIGNDDYVFSVNSTDVLKEKIMRIYFDEEFRSNCKKHLFKRAEELKAKQALEKLLKCYQSIRKE